jgi:hypothetical protein
MCAAVHAAALQERETDARLRDLTTLDSHHPWSPPATRSDWEKRREDVRRQVLVAAGLWPGAPKCEPRALIHGAVQRKGYSVQRVRFESLPGFFVTGSLYRPTTRGSGPFPAVLSPHGHDTHGRFTVYSEERGRERIALGQEEHLPNSRRKHQSRCVQLCRMGCVVFHYDMIGYADSTQLDHRRGFGDVEAELWGMSHFGLQTLDSIRALDFLISLPDVDPKRVAVTGASGGGTQTFILGAVDDRPDVLFPAVMVSTHMQGGCICENASGLRVGSGNVEFAAIAAPRPLGMTAADDWTLQILEDGLPQLKQLYALYSASDLVNAWCHPEFPHNYNRVSRGHMYEWLNTHLGLGVADPNAEPPIEPLSVEEMTVFTAEHPSPDGSAGLEEVRAAWLAHCRAEIASLLELARSEPAEYRRVVGGALESMIQPPAARVIRSSTRPGPDAVTVWLTPTGTGQRLELRRWNHEAADEGAGTLLVVCNATVSERERFLLKGWSGPTALLRPLASVPVDERRHAQYPGYTWCYNLPLLAQRAHDVLTTLQYLAQENPSRPVTLVGLGDAAPAVVIAAAFAHTPVAQVLVDGEWDFDQIEELSDPNFLPRALRHGGLGAFAALISPTPLHWLGDVPPLARALYASEDARLVGSVAGDADSLLHRLQGR